MPNAHAFMFSLAIATDILSLVVTTSAVNAPSAVRLWCQLSMLASRGRHRPSAERGRCRLGEVSFEHEVKVTALSYLACFRRLPMARFAVFSTGPMILGEAAPSCLPLVFVDGSVRRFQHRQQPSAKTPQSRSWHRLLIEQGLLRSHARPGHLDDHGVVDNSVDGGCCCHRILEDLIPL